MPHNNTARVIAVCVGVLSSIAVPTMTLWIMKQAACEDSRKESVFSYSYSFLGGCEKDHMMDTQWIPQIK